MKRTTLWMACAMLSLAALPAAAQSVEERLRDLKRLRDAGLIAEPVYVEQQRRILEAPPARPQPAGPAAIEAKATATTAVGGTVLTQVPPAGTLLSYRIQDRLFSRRQHVFAVQIDSTNGPLVNELVQVDQGARTAGAVDAQAVRFLQRDLGGNERFIELSPYLLNAAVNGMLPNPPTHYPLDGSSEAFRVRVNGVVEDQVSVPAGTFKTVRVDVTGERGASGFPGLSGGLMNTMAVTRFRYTAWYSREMNRYVMVRHQQFNPGGSPVTDEVVQLVSHSMK
jgi:hypothetical protein